MSNEMLPLECRHVVHVRSQFGGKDDIHFVKEVEHQPDGTIKPKKRILKNFKRPYWVTREGFRNHDEKKEWEDMKKLQRYESTQSQLTQSIARSLGRPGMRGGLRQIAASPYLYGADIASGSILKQKYRDHWEGLFSASRVAVLDIETDVINGTGEPIIVGLTCEDRAFVAVDKSWLGTTIDPEEQIQKKFDSLLGEYKESRNINLEVVIADTPAQACAKAIAKAHEWMPDIITCWNILFDLGEIEKCLLRGGYDPAYVFSDPDVPNEFKYYRFNEGPNQRITASGKVQSLSPAERWHSVTTPASFQFIDAMCFYYMIRIALGKEPSYSLDFILDKNLGIRKLRFEEAEHRTGLGWHELMQSDYKIEYIIYNLFDCISVELLDEKNGDLRRTLPIQAGPSLYDNFNRQPRRLVDELHFECLNQNKVIATTPPDMAIELDDHVLDMTGWIVTLPSYMTADNGVKCVKELPDTPTYVRKFVSDLDCEKTYPTVQIVLNISKETTHREYCKTKGVAESVQRRCGVNLTAARTNSVQICRDMMNYPPLDELYESIMEKRQSTT